MPADDNAERQSKSALSRRDALKSMGAVAAGLRRRKRRRR